MGVLRVERDAPTGIAGRVGGVAWRDFDLQLFEISVAAQRRLYGMFGYFPQPKPTLPSQTPKIVSIIWQLWLDCQSHDVANDLRHSLRNQITVHRISQCLL